MVNIIVNPRQKSVKIKRKDGILLKNECIKGAREDHRFGVYGAFFRDRSRAKPSGGWRYIAPGP
jgi:hypothetical protein